MDRRNGLLLLAITAIVLLQVSYGDEHDDLCIPWNDFGTWSHNNGSNPCTENRTRTSPSCNFAEIETRDCECTPWYDWGTWSHNNGSNACTENRTRTSPSCNILEIETRDCVSECTPWYDWGTWSYNDDSNPCTENRTRTSSSCNITEIETRDCVSECTPWYDWGTWSHNDDSNPCTENRTRTSPSCNITEIETRDCVHGRWTNWGQWICDVTCGNGEAVRHRTCTNPTPQNSGADCVGDGSETQSCSKRACPVHGRWTNWGQWICDVTCGNGEAVRHRTCTNPTPQNSGADCVGDGSETQSCSKRACPVHGRWTNWGQWICDVTCGNGEAVRHRTCTNPTPQNSGADCVGDGSETQSCSKRACPVYGGWSNWGPWICDVTCGNGEAVRHRTCTNPTPQNGGADCVGDDTDTQTCNPGPCPVDGGWSDWGPWVCDVTCDNGTAVRHRNCTNPSLQYGGSDCVGDNTETQACSEEACPVHGRKCQKTCRAHDKNSYCDKSKSCVCKKRYHMQSGKCVRDHNIK